MKIKFERGTIMKKKISYLLLLSLFFNMFSGITILRVSAEEEIPVLWYQFEEGADASTVVNSGTGEEIDGTLQGGTSFGEGNTTGSAVYFDGASGYINMGTSEDLQPEIGTISYWYKKTEDTLAGTENILVWAKPDGTWNGEGWYLTIKDQNNEPNRPVLLMTDSNSSAAVIGDVDEFYQKDEWVHVAITINSNTNEVSIYRNGEEQEVATSGTPTITATTDTKYMGFNSTGYGGGYLSGALDDFRIYNRELSSSEIFELYEGKEVTVPEKVRVTGVTLDQETVSMEIGDTQKLETTVAPDDATNKNVIWETSDSSIVTVDEKGNITAVKTGAVTITVTTEDGEYKDTCEVAVQEQEDSSLNSSLELELKFDNNVEDTSANTIGAEWHGAEAAYVTGINGSAVRFNGMDNYIDLGTASTLQPENLTVSCWVKPEETISGEHMLVWNKPSGNYAGEGWYLSILDDSNPLKISTGTNPQESYASGDRSEFFPVNEWTHIAVTYDNETGDVSIFRNGLAQEVAYINKGSGIISNDTDHKYIGFNSPGYGGGYANVDIDEFKIYSMVATTEDIRHIYKAEGGNIADEDIAQLDLDQISVPTETRGDITLPTEGKNGSSISWESSNSDIISNTGVVARPSKDTAVILTATVSYGTATKLQEYTVTVKKLSQSIEQLQEFDMEEVIVTDPYYVNAFEKDVTYLEELESDRLLAGFRDVAGLEQKAERYGGWENTMIQGHTLGHYISALAHAYKNSKKDADLNKELKNRIDYIISELKDCQDANGNGYLFATEETHFDIIEGKASGSNWVPWYTMHKILSGLIDVYNYEGNETALEIASDLGDWIYNRASQWDSTTRSRVLSVEYGGMNDCLYELYKLTNDENHLTAAHIFDEDSLFTSLYNGNDVLANIHANTTIPKLIGALNRYRTLGEDEEFYLSASEQFWRMVVEDHTYITGGNSENEHFREAEILDGYRDAVNNETCNSYNMLKLTRDLFKVTGDVKYADFYERSLINEIMASQNPETGMATYFKAMGTGYFKVFGSQTHHFWCCTGTGMENFVKLNDSLYYHTDTDLYVNLYLSSTLNWEEKGLILTQEADLPASDKVNFVIDAAPAEPVNLKFRYPAWIAEGKEIAVLVNGETMDVETEGGYITISRVWSAGDEIELTLPMEVQISRLSDNEDAVAFTYGPVVLSAGLGTEDMTTASHGIQVLKATKNVSIKDYILLKTDTIEEWIDDLKNNIVKTDGEVEFTLRNTDEDDNLVFTPHYKRYEDRYGIYFYLVEKDSETFQETILANKKSDKLEDATIDVVQITNDQHELQHNLQGNSEGGSFGGYNLRHANTGQSSTDGFGWFSYDMKVDPSVMNYLVAKYYSGDVGRTFNIYIDDHLLKEETVEEKNPTDFYDARYEIPSEWIEGKEQVTVKFANRGASFVGGVFDKLYILKDYDTDVSFETVTIDGEAASLSDHIYTSVVPANNTAVNITFTLSSKNALVYVDDILIDDTMARKIDLAGNTTTLNVKVVAEDEVTEGKYTVVIEKKEEETGGKPFAIVTEGNLDRTDGLRAVIEVDPVEGVNTHQGTEVVLFQLMKGNTPVSIVALERNILSSEQFTAYFNVDPSDSTYTVRTFVLDSFHSDLSAPVSLANQETLN